MSLGGTSITHTGVTTVDGGTLKLSGASALGGDLVDNATVELDAGGGNWTFGHGLAGNGSLVKNGFGRVTLTGNVAFTGNTAVNAGTIYLTTLPSDPNAPATGASGISVGWRDTLLHQDGEFIVSDYLNTYQARYYDMSPDVPFNQRGQLKSRIDNLGNTTQAASFYPDGNVAETRQIVGGVTESVLYSYLSDGPNAGMKQSAVTRRQAADGSWAVLRREDYAYYDGVEAYGSLGDVKTVTTRDAAGNILGTRYTRYYVKGETAGSQYFVKYAFDERAFARLSAAFADPFAATNAQVAPYAADYYEYDLQDRVSKHVVAGAGAAATSGLGTYTYSYAVSTNADGYNSWKYKTVERRPDGNQVITYRNGHEQVMLSALLETATGRKWIHFTQYDAAGRPILQAGPSAVSGYDESSPDLLQAVNGNYTYLSDNSGQITRTTYYDSTTATETLAGGAKDRVQSASLEQGELGDLIPQSQVDYFARTAGPLSNYVLADQTTWANEDGTGAQTIRYSYSWYDNSNRVRTQTAILPAVDAAHNGSGQADTLVRVFDAYGRLTWTKDADGYIDYRAYDPLSGAVVKTITDVDTSQSGNFSDLPEGWATPAGGGLNLTTRYTVDAQGRITSVTDPAGRVSYTVYNDAAHEVRSYGGWDAATGSPTGPVRVIRQDWANGYDETLTLAAAPHLDASGRPDGSEAIDNVQTLARSYYNPAGQLVASDVYFNLSGLTYSPASALGTETVNFARTRYAYDNLGRISDVTGPTGTLSRTRYDLLGRATGQWIGTSAGDLAQTTAWQYDNGGVGDGNLTQSTRYASGSVFYLTRYGYDWRNRQTDSRGPDNGAVKISYDNLDQALSVRTYADANGNFSVDAGELRGLSESLYDERGRVYRASVYAVDPSSGTVGSNLTSNTWYNARGMVMKTSTANGLLAKSRYDGAGRLVASYTSYDVDEASYAEAGNVEGDTVIEQSRRWYDADGNGTAQADYQRLATDTAGTGELTAGNAYATASVNWYDKAGRLTNAADLGHESGNGTRYIFAADGTVIDADGNGIPDLAEGLPLLPNGSDDYQAVAYGYDVAGRLAMTTDNGGQVTVNQYRADGRVVRTIENYVDGVATENETDTDRTTEYQYDAAGRLTARIAYDPKGVGQGIQSQSTRYLYGDKYNPFQATSTIYPDSADATAAGKDQVKVSYDRLGRLTSKTDQRGVVHSYGYDSAGRLASDAVTVLPAGVDGAVRRLAYGYDDLGRLLSVGSYNAASGGTLLNQTLYSYDGWGNVIQSRQSHSGAATSATPAVQYTYDDGADAQGNARYVRLASVSYPDGRTLAYDYSGDINGKLNRLAGVADSSATLATYTYQGTSTLVSESHPQVSGGLTLNVAQDRFGRTANQTWTQNSGAVLDGYGYTYDRDSNRTSKSNALNSVFSESYLYDGLDRLTGTQRNNAAYQSWALDAQGNWSQFTNQGNTQTRTADAANEITGLSTGIAPTYDAAGNLTSGPKADNPTVRLFYSYDAWNRLVAVKADNKGVPGTLIATYKYDGQGRRIQKVMGSVTTDYLYNESGQVVQVNQNGKKVEQYVWDERYIDAPVLRDRFNADGTLKDRLYYVQDGNFNTTALVDTQGHVVERYVYDAYGQVKVFDGNWTARSASAYDNQILFAGYRLDGESGLYHVRRGIIMRDWAHGSNATRPVTSTG